MMEEILKTTGYDTDKAKHTHYLRNYEEYFRSLRDQEITLLELGVYHGGSMFLWRDYFQRGLIVGLDFNPIKIDDPSGRIRLYNGMQQDTALLDRIAGETAPQGFDVIIDDCSHIGELTRISFWHLFDNHLKPGGLYFIEDWSTGYWDSWFDGLGFRPRPVPKYRPALFNLRNKLARLQRTALVRRLPLAERLVVQAKRLLNRRQFRSHDYGLVGFIKELVDECAMSDITREDFGNPPHRASKFKEMRISPGHALIIKA